jgi:hypothetical protein
VIILDRCPIPPSSDPVQDIEDHRAEFAEATAKTPVDEAFREAFLKSKIRTARTHPAFDLAGSDSEAQSLTGRLGLQAKEMFAQPVPGGIGYGVFYTPAFKTGWGDGTALSCSFVCPARPAGNVESFLYLTATNRSGFGVEALVAYDGQKTPHFEVFDWARPDHWQTNVPFTSLGRYPSTKSAHGHTYQVLSILNSTARIGAGEYRNQVLLYDPVRGGWNLIYQYDYAATDAEHKTGWVGSWGPLVETFQPLYVQTKPLGALDVQLVSADDTGQWGNWSPLGPSNSCTRVDNVGFRLAFLDPNYAFAVSS